MRSIFYEHAGGFTKSGVLGSAHRRSAISRRHLARAAIASALVGSGFSALAAKKPEIHWTFAPVPLRGGSPVLGGDYHVFGPGAFDPVDAEPATITNFQGSVGLALISGTVTRTDVRTGEQQQFPFVDSDLRFMKGTFVGTDGKDHTGTFAFMWIDVYLPGPGDQLHDLNPTAFPPVGLFWTVQLPDDAVRADLSDGTAILLGSHVPILDYGTVPNALFGGGPPPIPGWVSFKVKWSGVNERVTVRNTDPVFGGFAGEFVRNTAQMEWTAAAGDYVFKSEPMATSSSSFAEIGNESNGSFF